MRDNAYVLLDRKSSNFLGEWSSYDEAEEAYLSYLRASPEAVADLELWHEGARIHVDDAKIRAVTTA